MAIYGPGTRAQGGDERGAQGNQARTRAGVRVGRGTRLRAGEPEDGDDERVPAAREREARVCKRAGAGRKRSWASAGAGPAQRKAKLGRRSCCASWPEEGVWADAETWAGGELGLVWSSAGPARAAQGAAEASCWAKRRKRETKEKKTRRF
ncbi:hypothetical protein SEVIR_8G219801v4 [Setaria viridis]